MFHTSVKSKTPVKFGTMAIAAVMLLFGSGPIIGNEKALAANLAGSGLADPDPGISSPHHHSHTGSVEMFFTTVSTTSIAAPAFIIAISSAKDLSTGRYSNRTGLRWSIVNRFSLVITQRVY